MFIFYSGIIQRHSAIFNRSFRNVRCYTRFSLPGRSALQRQDSRALRITPTCQNNWLCRARYFSKKTKNPDISSVVTPVGVSKHRLPDGADIGAEITGTDKQNWSRSELLKLLNSFYRSNTVKDLAADQGLDTKIFHKSFLTFKDFVLESEALPPELHILLNDLINGHGVVEDLFVYFLNHATKEFPHLMCMEELRKLSDLTKPANWYPEARSRPRKIIFHAGPTNSGKTYHALKRFTEASSGVYCGPLRLLASEIFHKTNKSGTVCDLVTGEERIIMRPDKQPADHISCTVEMTSVTTRYEVAVIDEIQMLRDQQRGWAWTRAFLGLCADEIHVCGEESAVDLVEQLAIDTCDDVEIKRYKRLTRLKVLSKGIDSFENIKDGDAIVCFSKNDIYNVSRELHSRNRPAAIIYGSLPPETKLAQAEKFNDPDSDTKVLVATDAIGMGINLSINRVILYSLNKISVTDEGVKERTQIPAYMALQIAGRAGRFGTAFEEGQATTFNTSDVSEFKKLLSTPILPVQKAGLNPTAEQIEQFHFLLPNSSLAELFNIFTNLSAMDDEKYFLCESEGFKVLAELIEHTPLSIREKYLFCCAPIKVSESFILSMFRQFAGRFGRGEPLTLEWLCQIVNWPMKPAKTLNDLTHLENVFDVTDLYLWLSYRFPEMFPECDGVRVMQKKLSAIITKGVDMLSSLKKTKQKETDLRGRRREKPKIVRKRGIKDMGMKTSDSPMQNQETQSANGQNRNAVYSTHNYTGDSSRQDENNSDVYDTDESRNGQPIDSSQEKVIDLFDNVPENNEKESAALNPNGTKQNDEQLINSLWAEFHNILHDKPEESEIEGETREERKRSKQDTNLAQNEKPGISSTIRTENSNELEDTSSSALPQKKEKKRATSNTASVDSSLSDNDLASINKMFTQFLGEIPDDKPKAARIPSTLRETKLLRNKVSSPTPMSGRAVLPARGRTTLKEAKLVRSNPSSPKPVIDRPVLPARGRSPGSSAALRRKKQSSYSKQKQSILINYSDRFDEAKTKWADDEAEAFPDSLDKRKEIIKPEWDWKDGIPKRKRVRRLKSLTRVGAKTLEDLLARGKITDDQIRTMRKEFCNEVLNELAKSNGKSPSRTGMDKEPLTLDALVANGTIDEFSRVTIRLVFAKSLAHQAKKKWISTESD